MSSMTNARLRAPLALFQSVKAGLNAWLEAQSPVVYKALLTLHDPRQKPRNTKMWAEVRPETGLVNALLAYAGFGLVSDLPSAGDFFLSGYIALITLHVMGFNDLIDRNHDVQKGKVFARDKFLFLGSWLVGWGMIIAVLLLTLVKEDPWLGLYVGNFWMLGLLYSFIPHRFVLQNGIVAFSAAAPVLCGTVHVREFAAEPFHVFLVVFSVIFAREILKDIEDRGHDRGYKATIPVAFGHKTAVWCVVILTLAAAVLTAAYPQPSVRILALCFVGVQIGNFLTFSDPRRVWIPKRAFDIFLLLLVCVLLASTVGNP